MDINNDTATTKLIESNKLRLIYSRRPCPDYLLPKCAEPDPPNADFPNNWGGYTDAMHVDFKTPSEHTTANALTEKCKSFTCILAAVGLRQSLW
jgi:hypothetical protein